MKYQVSFRAKTWYLHMWKYHRWNGYIINRAFHTKICCSKMVWYFIGVYIINRILHGRLEIRNFSSRVEKNISLVREYFSTLEEKFRISVRPCNILHCFVSHRVQYCIMKSLVVVCYQPTCDIASAMILHWDMKTYTTSGKIHQRSLLPASLGR